jgi:hypothetical protein
MKLRVFPFVLNEKGRCVSIQDQVPPISSIQAGVLTDEGQLAFEDWHHSLNNYSPVLDRRSLEARGWASLGYVVLVVP